MGRVVVILVEFWSVLAAMSPYLLFGFFVAGVLSVLIKPATVENHLGGKGLWPVIKASLFGVPLPLCSCGVLPVAASLRKHGASKGAAVGFLLSTPQTGIDSIAVTYSLLGPLFAIFRPVIAFITGLIGGAVVDISEHSFGSKIQPRQNAKCQASCCDEEAKPASKIIAAIKFGFWEMPKDIASALIVGLVIAAIVSTFVPDNFFADKLGTGIVSKIVMMIAGIPVYVCSSASVPIAAAMIVKGGLSPGAALVFLMTGPATNAAAVATVWKVFGHKSGVSYLATVAICALGFGVLLDWVAVDVGIKIISHQHELIPPAVKTISAVILLAILIAAVIKVKPKPKPKTIND